MSLSSYPQNKVIDLRGNVIAADDFLLSNNSLSNNINSLGATPESLGIKIGIGLDDTSGLQKFFETGGNLFVPDGDYLIPYVGPDSGGVIAELSKPTKIVCGPGARFYTDSDEGVDSDLIRLVPKADGADNRDPFPVEWIGGFFDQRNQKVSTVVPSVGTYPPLNPGTSATTNGLWIRAQVVRNGLDSYGFSKVTVDGTRFQACDIGDTWEVAGGDSGLLISGCPDISVKNIWGYGSRDLVIYITGDGLGNGSNLLIDRPVMENSYFGVAVKRAFLNTTIIAPQAENVAGPIAITTAGADGQANRATIISPVVNKYFRGVRLDYCKNVSIIGGTFTNAGYKLADGTNALGAPHTFYLAGSSYVRAENTVINGCQEGYEESGGVCRLESFDPEGINELSQHNYFGNMTVQGLASIGGEASGEADNNTFGPFLCSNVGVDRPTVTGTNSSFGVFLNNSDGIWGVGGPIRRNAFSLTDEYTLRQFGDVNGDLIFEQEYNQAPTLDSINWGMSWKGDNSVGTTINYGGVFGLARSVTEGSEIGEVRLQAALNGTLVSYFQGFSGRARIPYPIELLALSGASVSTPDSGYVRLFFDLDSSKLSIKDSSGSVIVLH